jgi:2,3,4,5-tetrahydropyridine-2,6-dicarboxylate N-succinyltransferase
MATLEARINALATAELPERSQENLALLSEFRAALNRGEIRVAEPVGDQWRTNVWVKKGILLHLAIGSGIQDGSPAPVFPAQQFGAGHVRIPVGGVLVRDGAFVGPGATCMPGVFVDVGAYIGAGSMLDCYVTVGLCAQIGERTSISSGTHIGGFLGPPAERLPTILCDEVIVGGNCGIYGGVYVGRGAVLAAGTILTGQSRVYDAIKKQYTKSHQGQPLAIPANAIVAPGARAITKGPAAGMGLMLQLPVIVGYRDQPGIGEDFLAGWMD